MCISIIIPTYNCENTLENCLNSLLDQDYYEYEIIIVDDGSTDNTFKIAKSFSESNSNRIKVYEIDSNKGAPYCMNFGIRKSIYDWIGIFDGDAVAPKDWMRKAINSFGDADIVGGCYIPNVINDFQKAVYLLESPPDKEILFNRFNYKEPCLSGTNFFFKRKTFDDIGGFDKDIKATYDRLFQCNALEKGYTLKYIPGLFVYHPCPKNLKEYLHRIDTFRSWLLLASKKTNLLKRVSSRKITSLLFVYSIFLLLIVLEQGISSFLLVMGFSLILLYIIKLSFLVFIRKTTFRIGYIATFLYFLTALIVIKNKIFESKPKDFWK